MSDTSNNAQRVAEASHTPGPWSTGGIFGPGTPNAMTWIWGPRAHPDHQSGPIVATDVLLKNAYLIAAAPDLLAALKELLASELTQMPPFEDGKDAQDAWADRRAKARNDAAFFIAKAEGRS